jgi:UDP-2,3-diacylglucosamine pyrophosphatase LpxH
MEFLEYLELKRDDLTHIVICGDFLDLWYKDLHTVIQENTDVLDKLQKLKSEKNIEITYLVGNHDYYFHKSENQLKEPYTIQFDKELCLTIGGKVYRFLHGDIYDYLQNHIISEALCFTTDLTGMAANEVWNAISEVNEWTGWRKILAFYYSLRLKGNFTKVWDELMEWETSQPSSSTDESPPVYHRAASKACKKASSKEVLIFGHTHEPGFNEIENVVNCGSWIPANQPSKQPPYTYVEINNNFLHLWEFKGFNELPWLVDKDKKIC